MKKHLQCGLTAALTLALLLTACGGGGGSASPEAQAEANVMRAINNGRAVALANDDGMRAVANSRLDDLDASLKGNVLGYEFFNKVGYYNRVEIKNDTLTLVAKYDYKDTTLQKIIDRISDGNPNSNLNFSQSGNGTSVGVVARTIRGQTYIAISLQVKT